MKVETQKALDYLYELVERVASWADCRPCDVTYNEVQKYAKEHDEADFFASAPIYRKMGGFTRIRDAKYPPVSTETKSIRRQLQGKANANRRESEAIVDTRLTLEAIEKFSGSVFGSRIKPAGPLIRKPVATKRYIHALWSDLHYGSDLLIEETGVANYGIVEESRRTAKFVQEIISYKPQYRSHTK